MLTPPAPAGAPAATPTYGALTPPASPAIPETQRQAVIASGIPGPRVDGLSPAATAEGEKTFARETAQAQVKQTEETRKTGEGKEKFEKTFDRFVDQYKKMAEQGTLITAETPMLRAAGTAAMTAAPGLASVVSPKQAAPIVALQNLRQAMVASLIAANPGMSSKSIDSNAELRSYLDSLTSPNQPVEAIVDTLNALSERYGSGKQISIEDVTGRQASAGETTRGRRATAPETRPAPALTPQDREALSWANANPNDPRAAAIKQRLGVR